MHLKKIKLQMDVHLRNVNFTYSGTYKLKHSISNKMFMKHEHVTILTDWWAQIDLIFPPLEFVKT